MSVYKESIDWLKQSIESILQQTFSDFEFIIICDNPSYVEAIDLLRNYSKNDYRVNILVNEENIGLTKSLNKGIRVSKGEYIVRMDADDVSLPKRIEKQVLFMDKHPEIVASGTGAFICYENKEKRAHRYVENSDLRSMLIFDTPIFHPSAIFRKEISGELIQYDERFRYSQDYALWNKLIEKYYKLSNIDIPLLKYRVSDQQISTAKEDEQLVYELKNQIDSLRIMGIELSGEELTIFQDLTRRVRVYRSKMEMEKFIENFMFAIRERNDLRYSIIASRMMLIYVNRLSESHNLITCLVGYLSLSWKIRYFSIYCLLSLISKFVR